MKRDKFFHSLQKGLKSFPVVAILGPRQCGKTTLARRFENESPLPGAVHYLDLEDPAALAALDNPSSFLTPLRGLVIIDEVQRRPELFPILRVLADRPDKPASFLILGSASPNLLRQSSESLAGRIRYLELTPFTLQETGNQNDLWLRGGFPRSFLASDLDESIIWRKEYIRTFLEKDIPELGINIPSRSLRRFWMMLANYHGQVVNFSNIGNSLGVAHTTVKRYLDILTGTYMVRQLQPWHENIRKRQVKSPKIYFRDSGLFHSLLGLESQQSIYSNPLLGASWEGFAMEEVIRSLDVDEGECYFWATHNKAELDLLIFKGGKRLGYEIKYTDYPTITKSMRIAIEDLRLDRLTIIYPGDRNFSLEEKVEAVGLANLFDKTETGRESMNEEKEGNGSLKGFISYAHADKGYCDEIVKGIKGHANVYHEIKWTFWDDSEIHPGEDWHTAIQRAVEECDFAVLLISRHFYSSEYIRANELASFLARMEANKGFLIFPILVQPCQFDKVPEMKRYQHFVPNGDAYSIENEPNLPFSYLDGNPRKEKYLMDLTASIEECLKKLIAWKEREVKKEISSKHFRIISSCEELTPKEVFDVGRATTVRDAFYWGERGTDGEVRESLKNARHCMLVGSPLAGKTRTVYEALKGRGDIALLLPHNIRHEGDIAVPLVQDRLNIALLDDIHTYLKFGKENLESLLTALFRCEGLIVIATCRSGSEYIAFISSIDRRLREAFREIKIGKMTRQEEDRFRDFAKQQHAGKMDEKAFRQDRDKNIGSYFLGITEMKERYDTLERKHIRKYQEESRYSGPKELPKTLLKGLGSFYYAGKTAGKSSFDINKIKDFCARKFQHDNTDVGASFGPMAKLLQAQGASYSGQEAGFTHKDFSVALELLEDRGNDQLGFIHVEEPDIHVEEVYIERIIEIEGNITRIISELKRLYKGDFQREFLGDIYDFSKFVRGVKSVEEGLKVIGQMKKMEIHPNTVTYTSLIPLCKNIKEARELMKEMKQEEIKPDTITYNSLIPLCKNIKETMELTEEMVVNGIPLNIITFMNLLRTTHSREDIQQVESLRKSHNIKADSMYNSYLENLLRRFGI